MLKKILVTLVILTLWLNAGDEEMQSQNTNSIEEVCEKVYNDCSLKCEDNNETDTPQCFSQCEVLYDKCLVNSENEVNIKD